MQMLGHYAETYTALASAPDGQWVAAGTRRGTVQVWRTTDGKTTRLFSGPQASICSLAVANDGQFLAAGTLDRTIWVWRVADGELIRTLSGYMTQPAQGVLFTPGDQFLASWAEEPFVWIWQLADGTLKRRLAGPKSGLRAVVATRDGHLLALSGPETDVQVWDTGGSQLCTLRLAEVPVQLAIAAQGSRLVTAADGRIQVWCLSDGRRLCALHGPQPPPTALAVSADGQYCAVASADWSVWVWKLAKAALLY